MDKEPDLIIVGGGAAGVFSAIRAAETRPGIRILMLEKSNNLLAKVRVSGGGRCNVTNALNPLDTFSDQYPRGAKHMRRMLHTFSPTDTVNWFESKGVPLKTEPDLRIFPVSNRSESIITCLINNLERHRIEVSYSEAVKSVRPVAGGFELETSVGKRTCSTLVIACGGIPKATSYQWLEPLQLEIIPPVPSLFTFNIPNHPAKHLMGLSAICRIRIEGSNIEETGPFLITHWGFSGPAILRCSAWGARFLAEKNYEFSIRIHWLPEINQDVIREMLRGMKQNSGKKNVYSRMFDALPNRLWEYLCMRAGISDFIRWADLSNQALNKLSEVLSADLYQVSGKTTFKEEFVTCGGISLKEIDSKTCMSRKHPGLFFAGEILDVDGITGGFNFQHAWTSGFVAGESAASLASE